MQTHMHTEALLHVNSMLSRYEIFLGGQWTLKCSKLKDFAITVTKISWH